MKRKVVIIADQEPVRCSQLAAVLRAAVSDVTIFELDGESRWREGICDSYDLALIHKNNEGFWLEVCEISRWQSDPQKVVFFSGAFSESLRERPDELWITRTMEPDSVLTTDEAKAIIDYLEQLKALQSDGAKAELPKPELLGGLSQDAMRCALLMALQILCWEYEAPELDHGALGQRIVALAAWRHVKDETHFAKLGVSRHICASVDNAYQQQGHEGSFMEALMKIAPSTWIGELTQMRKFLLGR